MNDKITRDDMKYLYTQVLNEATSRSDLPDEIFGVPEERKYPLDTKEHVYSAIKLFNHVNKKYEEELADNINKKIKEYNITDINPGPTNRFSKYYNQPVKESTNIILEAPTDVDVEDDDVNDYSDDVEDDSDDTTEDDTDEQDLDDEANDYSDNIDSEDDNTDDSDTEDDVDTQSDEGDEPVDDTDNQDDTSTDDGETDDASEDGPDDTTDDEFNDEPNDYSDSVEGDGSGDDSDTTEDDTSTDDSDDMSDSSDDSMESDDENNTLNNNNIIKNYNLLMDFQKLHTSLEDILVNLKAASYKTSLQNAILRRVLSNVETLKDEVLSYIEYNFGSNYTQNLYYFNTYIQLLKITLEMMKKMGELNQEDK